MGGFNTAASVNSTRAFASRREQGREWSLPACRGMNDAARSGGRRRESVAMFSPTIAMQPTTGTWNSFQRTILQWNDLHPYNAVHGLLLPGPVDLERLRRVIAAVVERRGLTGLRIDRRRGSFRYEGGPMAGPVELIETAVNGWEDLAPVVERQLNAPFNTDGAVEPFRFLIADGAAGVRIVLVYFHVVADADAIVRLLHDIAAGYRDPDTLADLVPLARFPRRHDLAMLARPALLLRWLGALPAAILTARRSCRPNYRDAANLQNGFRYFPLPAVLLRRLQAVAKTWAVTLNDVFLAAALLAVSPLASTRHRDSRRRLLSVASIVNVRKEIRDGDDGFFGLALGSFRVAHEVPPGISLGQLARAVHQQTARIKASRSFLFTPLQLAVARWFFARYAPVRQRKFYQNNQPLWAGITNLNVNPIWEAVAAGSPPDYFRAVSTGPATPLVFSITTAGQQLNVGLSFRTTVFLNSDIERVQDGFQNLLANAD